MKYIQFLQIKINVELVTHAYSDPHINIQGDPGGKGNNLGGDFIGNCLILNFHQDTAVRIFRPNVFRFLFVGLDEERSLHKKDGHTRRIARSHFGCCCLHKERRSSTHTNNTRSSHTSCKVHCSWRWDFRTFIVIRNTFLIRHEIEINIKIAVSDFCLYI